MSLDTIPWTLLQGEYQGRPLLIRFREFEDRFPRAEFCERLNIIWRMKEADANGLPSAEESARLNSFEDRLVHAVEDGRSVLAVVLTCDGKREFVFYTSGVGKFIEQLEAMPQEVERYPVEIHRNRDAGWDYFDAVTRED